MYAVMILLRHRILNIFLKTIIIINNNVICHKKTSFNHKYTYLHIMNQYIIILCFVIFYTLLLFLIVVMEHF